ncbi:histone H3-like centromeric protein cnp1 [Taenia solium]|eukprot:TsM_001102900 transcript=TsM_001102900 gene=TsM_001102900
MDGGKSRFLPAATSTPTNPPTDPRTDLNISNGSARSRRKRERLPQHRNDTGTEVLFAAARAPSTGSRNVRATNVSNVNNNNNAGNKSNVKRKRRRNVAGLIAAEIRRLQRTTDPLIRHVLRIFSRASFARVVRSMAQRMDFENALEFRWQAVALDCLQEAAEAFIVDFFSFAARAAAHAHRVTVMLADIHFISQFYQMLHH